MGLASGCHPTKGMVAFRGGLAFPEQVLESVPVTESDERVDFFVTDDEVD
jgi:5-formyltetrahydrofolate cyclo-ligase